MGQRYWTNEPPQEYTKEGRGIGSLRLWDDIPGAWNILAMSWVDMPGLLTWDEDKQGQFPDFCDLVPMAVGTALQMTPDGEVLGLIADVSTPGFFLEKAKLVPDLILPKAWGFGWWHVAHDFSARYTMHKSPCQIIKHTFNK